MLSETEQQQLRNYLKIKLAHGLTIEGIKSKANLLRRVSFEIYLAKELWFYWKLILKKSQYKMLRTFKNVHRLYLR